MQLIRVNTNGKYIHGEDSSLEIEERQQIQQRLSMDKKIQEMALTNDNKRCTSVLESRKLRFGITLQWNKDIEPILGPV